jgi:hypothetical protein
MVGRCIPITSLGRMTQLPLFCYPSNNAFFPAFTTSYPNTPSTRALSLPSTTYHRTAHSDDMEAAIPYDPPRGLTWVNTPRGPEARWAEDTADLRELRWAAEAALILRGEIRPGRSGRCSVEFLAQDAFHKSYVVRNGQREYVIRLNLPILPSLKTVSEVAILDWAAANTRLSVPRIYDHSSDPSNDVGLEFILMSKPPGKPLAALWRDLDFPAKEEIVRRIAGFASDTFRGETEHIGSLFIEIGEHNSLQQLQRRHADYRYMGPCVSPAFISPISQAANRGPFSSAQGWVTARMNFALADRRRRLGVAQASDNDESHGEGASGGGDGAGDFVDDPERLKNAIAILERLRPLIKSLFPEESVNSGRSMFFHSNLNKQNILVTGTMPVRVSVADWGFTYAVPLSVGCQYPAFLKGRVLNEQPIRAEYQDAETGEPSELYWERLDMYELTQLRRVFLDEMQMLRPEWVKFFNTSQRQRDFDLAISSVDDMSMGGRLRDWLVDMESGQTDFPGLEERID